MSEKYPYHKPQISLSAALSGLNEAMVVYFGKHRPCPNDVQTAMLLTPRALTGPEREETFNQLHLLTRLAYQYHLEQSQQEQVLFSLQEARRTLLLGNVFLEGVNYAPDRIDQGEAKRH